MKVDFELRNDGAAELVITDVHPTCGCTVASFDARIAPGAVGRIHAEIDTVDFAGPIAKTLTVLSNDPVQPRVMLTIKARVEPQVNAFPGYARFVFVQNQAPVTVEQWLWAENFADLRILAVKSPYDFVRGRRSARRPPTSGAPTRRASTSGSSRPPSSRMPRSARCATSWSSRPIIPSRRSSAWRSPASCGRCFGDSGGRRLRRPRPRRGVAGSQPGGGELRRSGARDCEGERFGAGRRVDDQADRGRPPLGGEAEADRQDAQGPRRRHRHASKPPAPCSPRCRCRCAAP